MDANPLESSNDDISVSGWQIVTRSYITEEYSDDDSIVIIQRERLHVSTSPSSDDENDETENEGESEVDEIESEVPEVNKSEGLGESKLKVPEEMESEVLEEIESKDLQKIESGISEVNESKVLEEIESGIPEVNTLLKGLEESELELLEEIESKDLEKIESEIFEVNESKVLEESEMEVPEEIKSEIPEVNELKVLEEIESKDLGKIETEALKESELKVLEESKLEVPVEYLVLETTTLSNPDLEVPSKRIHRENVETAEVTTACACVIVENSLNNLSRKIFYSCLIAALAGIVVHQCRDYLMDKRPEERPEDDFNPAELELGRKMAKQEDGYRLFPIESEAVVIFMRFKYFVYLENDVYKIDIFSTSHVVRDEIERENYKNLLKFYKSNVAQKCPGNGEITSGRFRLPLVCERYSVPYIFFRSSDFSPTIDCFNSYRNRFRAFHFYPVEFPYFQLCFYNYVKAVISEQLPFLPEEPKVVDDLSNLHHTKSTAPNIDGKIQLGTNSQIEPKVDLSNLRHAESVAPNFDSKIQPETNPQIKPKIDLSNLHHTESVSPNFDGEIQPETNPQIEPKVDLSNLHRSESVSPNFDGKIQPETNPQIEPKVDLSNLHRSEPVAPNFDGKIQPETNPQMQRKGEKEKEINSKSEENTSPNEDISPTHSHYYPKNTDYMSKLEAKVVQLTKEIKTSMKQFNKKWRKMFEKLFKYSRRESCFEKTRNSEKIERHHVIDKRNNKSNSNSEWISKRAEAREKRRKEHDEEFDKTCSEKKADSWDSNTSHCDQESLDEEFEDGFKFNPNKFDYRAWIKRTREKMKKEYKFFTSKLKLKFKTLVNWKHYAKSMFQRFQF